MKIIKLIMCFLLFAGIASCSNDDDGDSNMPPANDPILGEWRLDQVILDGEEEEIGDCEAQTRINFLEDGTVTFEEYFPLDEECILEEYTENWEPRGNNVYRFTDEDGDSYNVTVVFSSDKNAFTISEDSDEGSFTIRYVRV